MAEGILESAPIRKRVKPMVVMVLALAIAALVGWAALSVSHAWQCHQLEGEYLNSVAAAKQGVLLGDIAPDSEAMAKVSAGLAEPEIESAEKSLSAIYMRCGDYAGRTAFRKGSQLILGSS